MTEEVRGRSCWHHPQAAADRAAPDDAPPWPSMPPPVLLSAHAPSSLLVDLMPVGEGVLRFLRGWRVVCICRRQEKPHNHPSKQPKPL